MSDHTNSEYLEAYRKKENKREMQQQLISFALMIIFTLVAFTIVVVGSMSKMVIVPILIALAIVQVAFQFYYFMHLKHDGHLFPTIMLYGGIWAAFLTTVALTVITWW